MPVATRHSSSPTSRSCGKVTHRPPCVLVSILESRSFNARAAMSDFIQFVRTTVPIAAWTSTTVAGIRGQAQRLLPLVISSRRHVCSVCGQVPSALPMVRARMLRAPSIYRFAFQKTHRSSLTLLLFCSCPTAIMCTAMVAPLRYSTFPFPICLALRSHPRIAAFHPRAPYAPPPSGLPPTRRKHILPPVRPACSAAPPRQRSKDMMDGECTARAPACAISKYSACVSVRLCDNLRYSG